MLIHLPGYFGQKDPQGVVGLTLLIVPGVHGRLSNISSGGTFIEDEQFDVGGKVTIRKKGSSVKGLMHKWVELRSKFPHMFNNLSIMQQPAAVIDGVLQMWRIQELSQLYGRTIWQRDTLGTHMTDQAYETMALGWQCQHLILEQMTPVLQLTDTDVAFLLKSEAATAKEKLIMDLKAKSRQEGVRENFSCGHYEILRIVHEACNGLTEKMHKQDTILSGLRRNGMLAWRPDLIKGRLVRSDDQFWTKERPQGCHRVMRHWLRDRHQWLDEMGVPVGPNYHLLEEVRQLADHEEAEYCASQEDQGSISSVYLLKYILFAVCCLL